ncbi:lipoprotein [Amycolatopsis azurea DSM 43854]|uniref:Lipoprotein n=1 Tax=Amycolatopsis azurea DSM 43854 TaxID=1238180 RepID=M2PSG2_9PSEU|nr:lipoprotein [Amycolatopsis azurea DSM 43854]
MAVVGVALALAGCSASESGGESAAMPMTADGKQAAPNQGAPNKGSAESGDSAGRTGSDKAPAPAGQPGITDRKLVRTASLELTAPNVADVISQVRVITQGAAGYTGQESTQEKRASVNVVVPSERLDGVLDQLGKLGKQVRREVTATDVTEQMVDIDSRLATQRASVERIRALLARATSVSEIASVESELTSREAELESLQKRRESLAGSVAMSTISLQVKAETVVAEEESRNGFFGGLANGWDAFLTFGGGLLTVIGAMAPFLLVFGVPAAAVIWWLRKRRRPAEPAMATASELPSAPPLD